MKKSHLRVLQRVEKRRHERRLEAQSRRPMPVEKRSMGWLARYKQAEADIDALMNLIREMDAGLM